MDLKDAVDLEGAVEGAVEDKEHRRASHRVGRTLLGGRLKVESVLGVGGMGAVFEVEHCLTGHRRALKVLHRSLRSDREVVRRFHREASVVARLGVEPAVVQTFDMGTLDDGSPYILMELLEGVGLDRRLTWPEPLPWELIRHIGEGAARGLSRVHRGGIVHRDIKPENLFLVGDPERPAVKLIDFGISKLVHGDEPLEPGMAVGTPHYMAPEQALGHLEEVDERSDVYALGVTLYECATGRLPFEGSCFPALVYAIHAAERPAIRDLRADVPLGLEAIIDRAMHRDRAHRFESMEAMAEALAGLAGSVAEEVAPTPSRQDNRLAPGPQGQRPSRNPRSVLAPTY